jgi:hypothetical protein
MSRWPSIALVLAFRGCASEPNGSTASDGPEPSTESTSSESDGPVATGATDESTDGGSTSATSGSAPGDTTATTDGGSTDGDATVHTCQPTACSNKIYECGDCLDNDGDGLVDAADPSCWGPCDNNEAGWKGNIPGQVDPGPCVKVDCYFDMDGGAGNDDCHWAGVCDPLDPYGWCTYDPEATVPGSGMTCEEAMTTQSLQCAEYCGPLVPNGCDCFGCCEVTLEGETRTVFLGTESRRSGWEGSCGPETLTDPVACAPCTQVPACLNPCEPDSCEICIGQTTLTPGCTQAECPPGVQPCLPEHENGDCPEGMACITGCCIPFPA